MLFALSGLICWCGISQVIGNSISASFENAFHVPPIYSTAVLVIIAAVIVLRKNATVKVLDVMVPVMAACYFFITIFIIVKNAGQVPAVFERIFAEAFGFRQGSGRRYWSCDYERCEERPFLQRGRFRFRALRGSGGGYQPSGEGRAAAGTRRIHRYSGDLQLFCYDHASYTGEDDTWTGGMDLLQTAMQYHLGEFGVIFIAVILWLFSFSTFLGILFYARPNVAYLFGDNWLSQTLYKILALVMLFVGGLAAYQFVWDLGDLGVGLMTVFNMIALIPLGSQSAVCPERL